MARFSRSELLLAVAAALGVMIFDVLTGVLIAVALSILVALGKLARPHDAVLGEGIGLDGWVDAEAYEGSTTLEGLLVYRFDAPLFFANVGWFRQRLRRAMDRNPGDERWVVIDFEGIGSVDATAVEGLCELVDELHEEGVVIGTAAGQRHRRRPTAAWRRDRADRRRERPRHHQPSRPRLSRRGPATLNRRTTDSDKIVCRDHRVRLIGIAGADGAHRSVLNPPPALVPASRPLAERSFPTAELAVSDALVQH